MPRTKKEWGICVLHWTLGIVVLIQSIMFVTGPSVHLGQHALPDGLRYALGGTEAVAALLFLIRPTLAIGAWILMAVFVAAIVIHLLHGQMDVGGLLVYLSEAFAVWWDRKPAQAES